MSRQWQENCDRFSSVVASSRRAQTPREAGLQAGLMCSVEKDRDFLPNFHHMIGPKKDAESDLPAHAGTVCYTTIGMVLRRLPYCLVSIHARGLQQTGFSSSQSQLPSAAVLQPDNPVRCKIVGIGQRIGEPQIQDVNRTCYLQYFACHRFFYLSSTVNAVSNDT